MTPTTTTTRPASTTLERLLDDELAFSPTFRTIYSSHLAMALVALDQMGAPPEVLERTFHAHASGEPERRDDVAELEERLAEVGRDGIEAVVRRRLPDLLAGPATALFHPAIRLAYGLDVAHEGQVAAALLDWERRLDVLPGDRPRPGTRRLLDVGAELSGHPPGTWEPGFDLHGTARRPELASALQGLALDDRTLDDVVSFALAAHVAADSFVTLHMVTGARALHRVAQVLDPAVTERLAAAAAAAMAVSFAMAGAPRLLTEAELDGLRRSSLPTPGEVAALAVADRDPHVIKLANVALVEEARTGDRLYRFVAARVVGLLPSGT